MADQAATNMEPKNRAQWLAQVKSADRKLSYDEVVLATLFHIRAYAGLLLAIVVLVVLVILVITIAGTQ
jgi:hypothetical protein